ncbi:recombinase [Tabrizicola sp. WMC-M-20]|nr:recombinase [Tabrizicola sp. WMC-M-20]
MNGEKVTSGHTIDDHRLSEWAPHEHGPDADHDHDDIDPGPLEENPIWLRDNVELTTVGIDVGSAGTQVIFSRIHLQRRSQDLTSRYVIVDRLTAYESPVAFTPYLDEHLIDGAALGVIMDAAYAEAGLSPRDVDTGVVILTGEALRRENSSTIANILAERGGDFVTATAGNHMEAMLAAYGSGAARASHAGGLRILNVDIGGGTTKLALVENGKVLWTSALHVGGRLIVTEGDTVIRLDPSGAHHAHEAGFHIAVGDTLTKDGMARVAATMAHALVDTLAGQGAQVGHLFLTDLPEDLSNLSGLMFSGGVGEYVYRREDRDFDDLGIHLGSAIRDLIDAGAFHAPLLPAGACIRATALGASEYSVQLSGQTSLITRPSAVLPRRNLQVVKPDLDLAADPSADAIAAAIRAQFAAFDLNPATAEAALALEWKLLPEYARVRRLADGIAEALSGRIDAGKPLHILIDGDIAQTLGGILHDELKVGVEMLVIDGIILRNFDFIDLGRIRLPSLTVPVTIKSLLFSEGPDSGAGQERIHFRGPKHHHHDHDNGHAHGHHHGHTHPHDYDSGVGSGEKAAQ